MQDLHDALEVQALVDDLDLDAIIQMARQKKDFDTLLVTLFVRDFVNAERPLIDKALRDAMNRKQGIRGWFFRLWKRLFGK